jgi:hypothetical protein
MPPTFLSIPNNLAVSGYSLFQFNGVVYVKIDTLGDNNIQEYNSDNRYLTSSISSNTGFSEPLVRDMSVSDITPEYIKMQESLPNSELGMSVEQFLNSLPIAQRREVARMMREDEVKFKCK